MNPVMCFVVARLYRAGGTTPQAGPGAIQSRDYETHSAFLVAFVQIHYYSYELVILPLPSIEESTIAPLYWQEHR
jgi:hypothetical protein